MWKKAWRRLEGGTGMEQIGVDPQSEGGGDETAAKERSQKRTYIDGAFARLNNELKQKRLLEQQNQVLRTLVAEGENSIRVLRAQNGQLLEAVRGEGRLLETVLEAMGAATRAGRRHCDALRRWLQRRRQPLEVGPGDAKASPRPMSWCTLAALCVSSVSLVLCVLLHWLRNCLEDPKCWRRHPPPI